VYRDWRGVFYPTGLPTKRWFAFYAARFDTVEINNTFYRLPSAETFAAWSRQAPPDFTYAVKASRYLTHRKKLKDPQEPLDLLLGRARQLGPHLGPILYQLPPHWRCDADRLRRFIAVLPPDLTHVFEFRDPSWCNDEIRALLTETAMSFCIHDMRGFPCPLWVTGPVVYLRFHGPIEAGYGDCYPPSALRTWAERIETFRQNGRPVYAYFNNDVGGHAVANARDLLALLGVTPAVVALPAVGPV
jgi:uncharacterized protein YecE (DUF72 family)